MYAHESSLWNDKSYVCKIDEKNVVRKCPSKYDLLQFDYDEVCLRWISSERPWIEAEECFLRPQMTSDDLSQIQIL